MNLTAQRKILGYSIVADSFATEQKTIFVKVAPTTANQPVSSKNVIPPVPKGKVNRFVSICHFFNLPGHIRPKCYKYKKVFKMNKIEQPYSKPRIALRIKIDLNDKSIKKLWIKKSDLFCHVVYTSMKTVTTDDWYFDSGCFRHMTGDKRYLNDYQSMPDGHVSFGNGGKGTLLADGLPKLKNILHMKGLKENIMSISQLCDKNLNVKFTKDSCKVLNKSG